jgi:predicted nucleic acid-binding Zn ribbon protein
MRRSAPRPVGPAASELARRVAPATTLAQVQERWRGAVGQTVAAESEPVAERGGVVSVSCRSSIWAQELELLSSDLLERLNAALGAPAEDPLVRGLRFTASAPRRSS